MVAAFRTYLCIVYRRCVLRNIRQNYGILHKSKAE